MADLYSSREIKNAELLFGCADPARVYLNGKLVHIYDRARRRAEPDTDKIDRLILKKGWNLVVCKIGNVFHGAGMYARFADEKGYPIKVLCPKLEVTQEYQPPPCKEFKGKVVASIDLRGDWRIKSDPQALGKKENWQAENYDDSG